MKLSVVRWAAIAGVLLGVTVVVALLLPGSPPKTTDSVVKITEYFGVHRRSHLVAGYIGFVDLFLAAWWLTGVYWLVRRNAGPSLLPGVAVIAGIFGAVMSTVGPLIEVGIAHTVAPMNDYALNRFAYDTIIASGLLSLIPFGAMSAAASLQGMRSGNLPQWLIWGGWLLTLSAFIGGIAALSENLDWSPAAYVAFGLSVLWILGTSVLMWTLGEDADAAQPAEQYQASVPVA